MFFPKQFGFQVNNSTRHAIENPHYHINSTFVSITQNQDKIVLLCLYQKILQIVLTDYRKKEV